MTHANRTLAAIAAGAVLAASTPGLAEPLRDEDRFVRREVQRAPSSIAGREIVQAETLIPAGAESGWHIHPGEEVGYLITGRVEMRIAGRALVILQAGDGFLIPPRTPHNAHDLGPETGRMLSTYLIESGQPTLIVVDPPAR